MARNDLSPLRCPPLVKGLSFTDQLEKMAATAQEHQLARKVADRELSAASAAPVLDAARKRDFAAIAAAELNGQKSPGYVHEQQALARKDAAQRAYGVAEARIEADDQEWATVIRDIAPKAAAESLRARAVHRAKARQLHAEFVAEAMDSARCDGLVEFFRSDGRFGYHVRLRGRVMDRTGQRGDAGIELGEASDGVATFLEREWADDPADALDAEPEPVEPAELVS